MQNIVNIYKDLFFLKQSPEALPYSPSLLKGSIFLYFFLHVAISLGSGNFSLIDSIWAYGGVILLSIAFLYTTLKSKNQLIRLHKLLLALFSVDVFFLGMALLIRPAPISVQFFLALICMAWSLSIKSHIFKKGFDASMVGSILIMLSFEFIRHIPVAILIWPLVQKLQ